MQTPQEADCATLTDLDPAKKAAKNKRKKENKKRKKTEADAKKVEEEEILKNSVKLQPVSSNPLFEVKNSPGKGLGVFAKQSIKSGAEIFREAAIVPNERNYFCVEACVDILPEGKKKKFMALQSKCRCGQSPCKETEVMKIFLENVFEISPDESSNGQRHSLVYEIAARVNHSCLPNSIYGFTKDLYISFRAIKNIKAGEEITFDYMDAESHSVRELRRNWISYYRGFRCCCHACSRDLGIPAGSELSTSSTKQSRKTRMTSQESLAEMAMFEKQNPHTEVLGKHTEAELAKFHEINKWALDFIAKVSSDCEQTPWSTRVSEFGGTQTKSLFETTIHMISALTNMVGDIWERNNEFGLEFGVLEGFLNRAVSDLEQNVKKVYEAAAAKQIQMDSGTVKSNGKES